MAEFYNNDRIMLELIIQYMPPRGEFDLYPLIKMIKAKESQTVLENYSYPSSVYNIYNYMVENGLAIKRYDLVDKDYIEPAGIENFGQPSLELTDSGRRFKELGSIKAYEDESGKDQLEAHFRTKMIEYNYWITVSIALSTFVAGVYYFFQIFDGKTVAHPLIAYTMLTIVLLILFALVLLRFKKRK